jgi:hypothetical protein
MQGLALLGGAMFACGIAVLWLARRGAISQLVDSYLAASACALIVTLMIVGGFGLAAVQLL